MPFRIALFATPVLTSAFCLLLGCQTPSASLIQPQIGSWVSNVRGRSPRPLSTRFNVGRARIHADFNPPRRHRVFRELDAKQQQILNTLRLSESDESIEVFLFADEAGFRRFTKSRFPLLPARRAFFVKDQAQLAVFAYWNPLIATDLNHEITHGMLHSALPDVPLWLDEGLAEFFEVPNSQLGFNRDHVLLLAREFRNDNWLPDLERLESLTSPSELTQIDYAEAWLWVHFLLETDSDHRFLLREFISQQQSFGKAIEISTVLAQLHTDSRRELLAHLQALANTLAGASVESTAFENLEGKSFPQDNIPDNDRDLEDDSVATRDKPN